MIGETQKNESFRSSILNEMSSVTENIEKKPGNQPISPTNFIGEKFYTKEEIERDLQLVARTKAGFEKSNIPAKFVEKALPDASRIWFGKNVKIIVPSEFDDIFNGIDNVIQILPDKIVKNEKDIRCIGFSVDFTTSLVQGQNKMFEESLAIYNGKIPFMKYFMTDIATLDGVKEIKLKNFKLPRIIMSCPEEVMSQSQTDLFNFENNPDDISAKEEVNNSKLKFYYIREVLNQLTFFSELAKRLQKEEISSIYNKSLESFKHIMKEQGISEEIMQDKLGDTPSLGAGFDLDADEGRFIKLLMAVDESRKKENEEKHLKQKIA